MIGRSRALGFALVGALLLAGCAATPAIESGTVKTNTVDMVRISFDATFAPGALKLAPASTLAPLHYTLLLWAVVFGALFFSDIPGPRILVGAGIVGLLVAHLAARLPGADVTVVDVAPERRAIAEHLGARFATPEAAPRDADVVFHTSVSAAGLNTAVDCAGMEATIVELSWYGEKDVPIRLGGAFHSQRLRLQSSQVGQVSPSRRPRWNGFSPTEPASRARLSETIDVDAFLKPWTSSAGGFVTASIAIVTLIPIGPPIAAARAVVCHHVWHGDGPFAYRNPVNRPWQNWMAAQRPSRVRRSARANQAMARNWRSRHDSNMRPTV